MKRNNKIQNTTKTLPAYSSEQGGGWDVKKAKIRQLLPSLCTLVFLATWISASINQNNLYLNEALLCSLIIVGILFFRAAEQNGDLTKQK